MTDLYPTTYRADLSKVWALLRLKAGGLRPADLQDRIPGINHRYARELLATLTVNGLAEVEQSDDGDFWVRTGNKPVGGLEYLDKESSGMVELNQTAKPTRKARKMSTKSATRVQSDTCLCGCGEATNGKSAFRQGHDARMVSRAAHAVQSTDPSELPAVVAHDYDANADIQDRINQVHDAFAAKVSDALATKFYDAAMNLWTKLAHQADGTARRPRATKGQVTVRGRQYDAIKRGDEVTYTTKSDPDGKVADDKVAATFVRAIKAADPEAEAVAE